MLLRDSGSICASSYPVQVGDEELRVGKAEHRRNPQLCAVLSGAVPCTGSPGTMLPCSPAAPHPAGNEPEIEAGGLLLGVRG